MAVVVQQVAKLRENAGRRVRRQSDGHREPVENQLLGDLQIVIGPGLFPPSEFAEVQVRHSVLVEQVLVAMRRRDCDRGARYLFLKGVDRRAHRGELSGGIRHCPNPVLNDAAFGVALDRHFADNMGRRHFEHVAVLGFLRDMLPAVRVRRDLGDLEARHRRRVVEQEPATRGHV
jgi:hypothetical protein